MSGKVAGLLLILLAVSLESVAQVCMKCGASQAAAQLVPLIKLNKRVWVALGLGLLTIETLVYTLALHHADVSVVFPMSSLSFVGIALLSALFVGESVSPKRWLGIALIIVGTVLVGAG
jgi:undecaprenyl phosphate-alpha-L-ara4N flippase subunit ArnE